MRAALFEGPRRPLIIDTVDDPRRGVGEVVIQVERCGICGSDLHVTEIDLLPPRSILGHEFAGTVVETGENGPPIGTRVTALPFAGCTTCTDCRAGYASHCPQSQVIGLGRPGGFAEFLALSASTLQLLPAGIDFDHGALVEPLAVAHHAVSLADGLRDARVLVLGAGPIGVAVTLFAARGGAACVIVSEPGADRRIRAKEVGATATLDPIATDLRTAFAAIAGGPPEIVFECSGVPGLLTQALTLVRNRGQVIVAGASIGEEVFTPSTFLVKQPTVRFSMAYTPADFEAVIGAMDRGQIRPEPLLTGVIPLDALPEMFEALRQPSSHCKVLVKPG